LCTFLQARAVTSFCIILLAQKIER
jgi:hypothetical protein